MNKPNYLNKIVEERELRINGRNAPDPNAAYLWNKALNSVDEKSDRDTLRYAYEYAAKIKYSHVGLSSDIYFAHPVRTAALSLLCSERTSIDFGIIGLLHNVFELSTTSTDDLSSNFGENITSQISALTVDRELQWNLDYKQAYYDKINSNPISCRAVKVFDKLDNLFVLGLNPDDDVRYKYLAEVRKHVLPMAEKDLPSVYSYLKALVENCEVTGYLGKI